MQTRLLKILLVYIAIIVLSSFADKITSYKHDHLFKIERSKDANEIFYDVNLDAKNNLLLNNPISIYWVNRTENRKDPLTWIQKKYAYGIEYLSMNENQAKFQFVSYNKRQFEIKKNNNGNFSVYTQSNKRIVIVNRIFIQIDGGTFWFPKISRVELYAQDINTNNKIIEIINP